MSHCLICMCMAYVNAQEPFVSCAIPTNATALSLTPSTCDIAGHSTEARSAVAAYVKELAHCLLSCLNTGPPQMNRYLILEVGSMGVPG